MAASFRATVRGAHPWSSWLYVEVGAPCGEWVEILVDAPGEQLGEVAEVCLPGVCGAHRGQPRCGQLL
jgi:hypothetical protein